MSKLVLSAILLLGFVGCSVEDEIKELSCSNLKVNAGSNKSVTINEEIVISGTVTKASGEISEYEWKKEADVLSTSSSFSYIPTTIGNQVLTFSVKDENGCQASDNMTLTVNPLSVDDNTEDNSQDVDDNTEDNSQAVDDNTGDNSQAVDDNTGDNSQAVDDNVEDNSQTEQNFNGKYTWNNGDLKVTIKSLKKTSNLITLTVIYSNLSNEDIKVILSGYTKLLDENGAIWEFEEDSAHLGYPGRVIIPSRKIETKIKFRAKNATNGTIFDFIGIDYYHDEFNHRILGIPAN